MLRAWRQWPHRGAAILLGLMLSANAEVSARAAEPELILEAATPMEASPPTLAGMWAALRRFFSKEDIETLYLYMRDAAIAALTQREPIEPPPELAFKLAVLEQRMRKEGDHYWRTVLLPELQRLAPRLLGMSAER